MSGTAASVILPAFNKIVDIINAIDSLPFIDLPDIQPIPDISKELVYQASYPRTPDSVMNYDSKTGVLDLSEPDCSPYPLDVMAIYALYQAAEKLLGPVDIILGTATSVIITKNMDVVVT